MVNQSKMRRIIPHLHLTIFQFRYLLKIFKIITDKCLFVIFRFLYNHVVGGARGRESWNFKTRNLHFFSLINDYFNILIMKIKKYKQTFINNNLKNLRQKRIRKIRKYKQETNLSVLSSFNISLKVEEVRSNTPLSLSVKQ